MTTKPTPCFRVEPDTQIAFNYVPRKYLNSSLTITNTSEQPIAYKVKTNVPTCYLVKPHVGTLPPHHSIDINITMQPTDYNPQNASINDKFLINIAPLPVDIDLAPLSDQTRLQQAWDSVPKNQVQSHKLKVVLKFEAIPRANLDKAEKSSEDPNKQTLTESKKSETTSMNTSGSRSGEILRVSQDSSSREDLKNSSMMMSFGNSMSVGTPSRSMTQGTGSWSGIGGDQALATSQTVSISKVGNEEKEKEKVVENKEVKAEEKSKEVREVLRPLEEKVEQLGKRIDELMNEKRTLMQKHQELTGKAEDQKRMLFELSEDNTKLKSELGNLKSSTFLEKSQRKSGQVEPGTYQLWHVLVVSLAAMILGAYFSSCKRRWIFV